MRGRALAMHPGFMSNLISMWKGLTQQGGDLAGSHIKAEVIHSAFCVAISCPEVLAQVPNSHRRAA